MKRKLFILILSLLSSVCYSAKMFPGVTIIKQSDGTVINVRAFGNHDFNYFTTTDGALLFKEGRNFYIAKINSSGILESTGVLAHEADRRSTEEKLLVDAQNKSLFMEKMYSNIERAKILREPMAPNSTLLPHIGSPKIPVILVEFCDTTFTVSNPKETFDKYLNATELFKKSSDPEMGMNYGSVKRYFTDMSFGKFSPDFDVYGPVKLEKPLKHYGAGSGVENMSDLFMDACMAIDGNVDFSQYDSNDDGFIDLIYIIYAGYSESFAGNSTECIYPKSGTLSNNIVLDGKTVCRYGVNNELNGTPEDQIANGLLINGIGLFCHEFSHCMGLPDMYPAAGSIAERCVNQNLDYWDLMDAGEYTRMGYRPTEYTAWERERFDWIEIDTLDTPCDITLRTLSDGGKAYRIINEKDETGHEYYIVENVQKTGWNRYIYGHGMLVYHVDYDDYMFSVGGCKVNNTAGHPRMTVIAADGLFMPEYFSYTTIKDNQTDIEKETNAVLTERYGGIFITQNIYEAEQAGDPFPGTNNVTELTDSSNPESWVYTGGYMNKPITHISEDAETGTVSFKFMGGKTADGIINIHTTNTQERIYSPTGIYKGRDKSQLSKGIYIINNKKVVK